MLLRKLSGLGLVDMISLKESVFWPVILSLCLIGLTASLDGSIIAIALPQTAGVSVSAISISVYFFWPIYFLAVQASACRAGAFSLPFMFF